uniref:helix-turn-helix domain-containing protein n=1 Tax=Sphingomonas sp. TaxID=28214 RepID=UPI00344D2A24
MQTNSQSNPFQETPLLYTTKEVAKIFHVSERTIQNWRDNREISFIQINSVIVYRKDDVDELLLEYRQKRRVKKQ